MVILKINDGSSVNRQRDHLIVSSKDNEQLSKTPIDQIQGIFINHTTKCDEDIFDVIRSSQIPVIWIEKKDNHTLHIPFNSYRGNKIRKLQLEATSDPINHRFPSVASMASCLNHYRELQRMSYYTDYQIENDALEKVRSIIQSLNDAIHEDTGSLELETLLDHKNRVNKHYYRIIGNILEQIQFGDGNRSIKFDRELISTIFDYGTHILIKSLEPYIALSGLDTKIGFLPSLGNNQIKGPALILDLLDEFRPYVVDEVICKLFISGKITPKILYSDNINNRNNKNHLHQEVKEKVYQSIIGKFRTKFRSQRMEWWFIHQGHLLAKFLEEKDFNYSPFLIQLKDEW